MTKLKITKSLSQDGRGPQLQFEEGFSHIQGYSYIPPGFLNSTAQQPRQTRQKGAYQ